LSQIRIGAIVHFVYVIILVLYIKSIFLDQVATIPSEEDDSSSSGNVTKGFKGGKAQRRNKTMSGDTASEDNIDFDERIFPLADKNYLIVLAVCLCYPIWYDGT
jgi:hypothetical protein